MTLWGASNKGQAGGAPCGDLGYAGYHLLWTSCIGHISVRTCVLAYCATLLTSTHFGCMVAEWTLAKAEHCEHSVT